MFETRHADKFRVKQSEGTENYIPYADDVFLERDVMDNLDSEQFRSLKRISVHELGKNLMIDDEMFCSVLDRLCYLEKKVKELEARTIPN